MGPNPWLLSLPSMRAGPASSPICWRRSRSSRKGCSGRPGCRITRRADDRAGRPFDLGVAAQQAVAVDGRGQIVDRPGEATCPPRATLSNTASGAALSVSVVRTFFNLGFVVEDVGVHQDGVGAQRDDRDGVEELGLAGGGLDGVVNKRRARAARGAWSSASAPRPQQHRGRCP